MKFKFEINNKVFEINNKCKDLDMRIKELVSTFPTAKYSCVYASLVIDKNKIVITKDNEKLELNIVVNSRELYQIFYFFIYYVFTSLSTSFIHSTVVSNGSKACLILGTFGAGKTTLSLDLREEGMEINSADHTLIEIRNNALYATFGTMRVKYQDATEYLPLENINKPLKIDKVVFLIGVGEKGKVVSSKIADPIRKMKKIWNSIIWVYTNPLQNFSNAFLNCIKKEQTEFIKNVSNLDCPLYVLRGDSKKIAKGIAKEFNRTPKFNISVLNDEVEKTFDKQLDVIKKAGLDYVEIRNIDNKHIGDFSIAKKKEFAKMVQDRGLKVSCIDSPIGKFDSYFDEKELNKYLETAEIFDCQYIRIFSNVDTYDKCYDTLKKMQKVAAERGKTLLVENETKHFLGELKFNTQGLNLLYDNDNYFQAKKDYLKLLKKDIKNIKNIHLRDYNSATQEFMDYGDGELKIKEIIKILKDNDYKGFLSLESHLPMNDFSKDKSVLFVNALKKLNTIIGESYK